MSLSSETQRVQQGVKDTLKALIQKLGGTVGSEKVDGYPALANAISNKLLPDNLLSAATAALYGKGAEATPNDVFAAISELLNGKAEIHAFSYSGTGTYDVDNPNSITADKPIVLAGILFYQDDSGDFAYTANGNGSTVSPNQFMLGAALTTNWRKNAGFGDTYSAPTRANSIYGKKSEDGKTFYWYADGSYVNAECTYNVSGYTYYGFYIC